MSSRISIARPTGSPSYTSDPHGLSTSRPHSHSGYRTANPDDPLEKIRAFGKTVEDNVEIFAQPLKPHLPALGRFLIVVTFLEDALRIMTQWSDQTWYLQQYAFSFHPYAKKVVFIIMCLVYSHRKFPWGISHVFLILNVIVMSSIPFTFILTLNHSA